MNTEFAAYISSILLHFLLETLLEPSISQFQSFCCLEFSVLSRTFSVFLLKLRAFGSKFVYLFYSNWHSSIVALPLLKSPCVSHFCPSHLLSFKKPTYISSANLSKLYLHTSKAMNFTLILMTVLVLCLAIFQTPSCAEPEFTPDPVVQPACGPSSKCMVDREFDEKLKRTVRKACRANLNSAYAGITKCTTMKRSCIFRTLNNGKIAKNCKLIQKNGFYCNCWVFEKKVSSRPQNISFILIRGFFHYVLLVKCFCCPSLRSTFFVHFGSRSKRTFKTE